MAEVSPLPGWVQSLYDHITEDFGLSVRPPAERDEMLLRLSSMVLSGALIRAETLLDEDERQYLDQILVDAEENGPKTMLRVAEYIASKGSDWGGLIENVYQEVRALAQQVADKAEEKKFEHADQSAEAVGDLLELTEDVVDFAKIDVPGISTVSIGVGLLFDPARFLRSPRERQERFFKQAMMIFAQTAGYAWFGLLLFTIACALARYHVFASFPKLVTEAVPDWYEQQSIGGQMLLLIALGAGLILVGFIVMQLFGRVILSRRLTPAFDLKVDDDELASTTVRPLLLSVFPAGVPKDTLWGFSKVIYRSVYINSGKPNSDDLKMLDEILKGGNEKAAVAFLKSKVRRYRAAMQLEAAQHCRDAGDIMRQIK